MANLGEAFVQIIADTSRFAASATAGIKKGMSDVEDTVQKSLKGIAESDAIDAIGDNLEDSVSNATDAMADSFEDAGSEIESSLTGVGNEASSVFDGVASDAKTAAAEGSSALESEFDDSASNIRSAFEGLFETIGENMGKFTIATGAAGIGAEAFARKNQDLNVVLGRVARGMDLPEESLRELAASTQDSTRPLEDILALFEIAQQRGADGADSLENYAMFWDTVGDATGENAVSLGKAGTALAALGIGLGEEEQALDAFGFIATKTTTGVEEFLRFTGILAAELGDLGLDVDDTAALLGAMERELGLSGRAARTEFRKAVNSADGDVSAMLETLGISNETLEQYKQELEGSGQALTDSADAFKESRTPVQELQASMESLIFQFPFLNEAAGLIAAPLAAMGPVLMSANAGAGLLATGLGKKLVTGIKFAIVGLGKLAIAILTNPIFLIGAVIVGVVAIIWFFRDEIIGAFKAAWDFVKRVTGDFFKWIGERVTAFADGFRNVINNLFDGVRQIWTRLRDIFVNTITTIRDRVIGGVQALRDRFIGGIRSLVNAVKGPLNMLIGFFNGVISGYERIANAVGAALRAIPSFSIPSWVPVLGGRRFAVPSFGRVSFPRIPQLALGGIVQGDTLARIGEAGREAVVPLDRDRDPLNIAGLLADANVGRENVVNVTINNPEPETASMSVTQELRKLSALGVFGD